MKMTVNSKCYSKSSKITNLKKRKYRRKSKKKYQNKSKK